MNAQQKEFSARVGRIERKARAMEHGSEARLRKDGLIEIRPARKPLRRFVPVKLILLLVVLGLGYKVFLLGSLGESAYEARLAALEDGSTAARVGSALMQVDPVTRALAGLVAPYLG
ncbi:hypothetical protein [Pseudooceanicola nanhaiensis]|jgi:hypothetical protein|uniref:Uncharacterized protein n=1 Tax=Pseudooceanicola nanhaiensis TaxID=375761 RepID=A0A917SYA1_9RHOB|nr:hypothetical protein [Pseudooceanicola nanhaiensis]GGM03421.1 hypothetical protein GCM10011534_26540 [Pseudooceanicola nanhaiensis]